MSRRTGNRSMVSRNVPLLASEADCERGKSSYQLAKRAAFRSASITYSRLRTSDFRSPARCIASSVSGASSTLMRFAAVRCSNASTNCSGPCRSVRSCETLPRELRRHLRVSLTSRPGRLLAWLRDRAKLAYGSSQDWAAKRYRPTRGSSKTARQRSFGSRCALARRHCSSSSARHTISSEITGWLSENISASPATCSPTILFAGNRPSSMAGNIPEMTIRDSAVAAAAACTPPRIPHSR